MQVQRLTKNILLLCIGVSSFVFALWLSSGFIRGRENPLSIAAPHVTLEPDVRQIDIGEVFQGVSLGETYVTNRSDEPIRIVKTVTNCRCSGIKVEPMLLPPGGRAKVVCRWDTEGLRHDRESSFALLYTTGESGDLMSCPLSIRANVMPFFDVVPSKLVFRKDIASSQSFKLVSRVPASPVLLTGVHCSHHSFSVVSNSLEDAVTVAFHPEHFPNDPFLRFYVSLETNCPTEYTYEIPIDVISNP